MNSKFKIIDRKFVVVQQIHYSLLSPLCTHPHIHAGTRALPPSPFLPAKMNKYKILFPIFTWHSVEAITLNVNKGYQSKIHHTRIFNWTEQQQQQHGKHIQRCTIGMSYTQWTPLLFTIHIQYTHTPHTRILFQRMNKNWLARSLAHSLNQFIHSKCSGS